MEKDLNYYSLLNYLHQRAYTNSLFSYKLPGRFNQNEKQRHFKQPVQYPFKQMKQSIQTLTY